MIPIINLKSMLIIIEEKSIFVRLKHTLPGFLVPSKLSDLVTLTINMSHSDPEDSLVLTYNSAVAHHKQ